ncbi:unnamed protein product [Phytomonas sp. Hart1]|nr:unnamed protein product [Phytomonas sp. Hart1]|eukprot:CCW71601.1 unnamed protein product [Phytomonas sp. isolate Hart1]
MRGTNRVFFNSDSTIRPLTALETEQKVSNQKTTLNTVDELKQQLDLSNLRVIAAVGLEELMLVTLPILVLTATMLEKSGHHERAVGFVHLMENSANMMYGMNSPEHDFLVSLRNLCTVKL